MCIHIYIFDTNQFITFTRLHLYLHTHVGAGLFGALQHVDLTAIAEMRERRGYDMDDDDDELSDMEEEPEWKKDRIELENDLEKELGDSCILHTYVQTHISHTYMFTHKLIQTQKPLLLRRINCSVERKVA